MGEEIDMAYSDRELLARLIECEAGGAGEAVLWGGPRVFLRLPLPL